MKEGFVKLPRPLDALMIGLERKAVTNFYGEPGAGKTNICLLAALECARSGGTVAYIDTEGGFSVERVKQIERNVELLLERIRIFEPRDFGEQGRIIRTVSKGDYDMIIVDSMVALYRLEYAEKNGKGQSAQLMEANRELSKQMSVLSSAARERNMPVIVTSHIFSNWETGEDEVIGGESIKYWSKAMVKIERTGRMSERKAIITKHRFIPEGGEVKFEIVNEGIRPARGFRIL